MKHKENTKPRRTQKNALKKQTRKKQEGWRGTQQTKREHKEDKAGDTKTTTQKNI